jgi:predicted small secreted protein
MKSVPSWNLLVTVEALRAYTLASCGETMRG